MIIHPDILTILDNKMNCPSCNSTLFEGDWYFHCKNKLCADFKILNFGKNIYNLISIKSSIGRDSEIVLAQDFIENEITLIFYPQLDSLIIPSFQIDFKNLDLLPNKLRLYLVLS